MDKATHSHLIKGYIITICGGLGWAIGGACGQILFRDCGVDADWLVPIRMFLAGLMVLAIAKLCGKPICHVHDGGRTGSAYHRSAQT